MVLSEMTSTNCIMPRSSWMRMWQCSTYCPVKSTNRLRILNQPGMNSLQFPVAGHCKYGWSAGAHVAFVHVSWICRPLGMANVSHQIHQGGQIGRAHV